MTEASDTEKMRKFVVVSVFERPNEELIGIHDEESEIINSVVPLENGERKKSEFIPATFIIRSSVESHVCCLRKHIITIITCLLLGRGLP